MAWTAPHTAVAHEPLTAAQYNATVVDNLHESALAKSQTQGTMLVSAGLNQVGFGRMITMSDTTNRLFTSPEYTDLDDNNTSLGPVVQGTCRSGFTFTMSVEGMALEVFYAGFRVSGDKTTIPPSDEDAIKIRGLMTGSQTANHYASITRTIPWSGVYTLQPMARSLASTDGWHTCTITVMEF